MVLDRAQVPVVDLGHELYKLILVYQFSEPIGFHECARNHSHLHVSTNYVREFKDIKFKCGETVLKFGVLVE